MKANDKFSGISERKYRLMDILSKTFTTSEGELRPYYEIWVKIVSEDRVVKFKPFNTEEFGKKLAQYKELIGKDVFLHIEAKEIKGLLFAVVADILPVL